jgi:hypothetical protein
MKDDKRAAGSGQPAAHSIPNRILGSLRDALNAASRDERTGEVTEQPPEAHAAGSPPAEARGPALAPPGEAARSAADAGPRAPARRGEEAPTAPLAQPLSAAQAVREAKAPSRGHYEADEPTTRALRAPDAAGQVPKTQILRGKPKTVATAFIQDPVVGWLVVVQGQGLGAFRPVYEGNNAVGRGKNQRIPIDFGDETISAEEQAYIRYDSVDRSFLFVPNLSKTNIVLVNDKKPTAAVKLEWMDVITMGRTKLAFIPFCGEEFDWSELPDAKE